jgi:hypothetical protein
MVTGERKALIIANDEYEQESLRDLLAPTEDAVALGRVLGDPQIGNFAVQVMRNEPAHVIEAEIENLFSESRPDDVLLLHYSGHGLKSESGELFFAASNTRPRLLRATAVPADFVQRCMQDARSRSIVLLLDCCYGGAFSAGVKVKAAGDVNVLDSFPRGRSGGGRGRAVITASNSMEYAFEGDQLADDQHQRPSVFTSVLVEGLATGDADRDEDGQISLSELYDYVFDKVQERNSHQTPSGQFELEGGLVLARSRRQRIHPAAIPADLRAAMTDPSMYARRGAVHELESRIASEDLPVAAGAYEALAEVARTDIAYVADLAASAMGQAAIRPADTELHFGEHRQGSDPPHRTIRLPGPPIARACVPQVSGEWIRVTKTAEGLDVSVDTAGTGTLRGNINLKGPTGTAVIAIDVELVPVAAQVPAVEDPKEARQAAIPQSTPSAGPSERQAPPQDGSALTRRRRIFAGSLAVTGGALAIAGLFPIYMSGETNGSGSYQVNYSILHMIPGWWAFLVGTAALDVTAGICVLNRRWERLGRGLLLAASTAAVTALAFNLSYLIVPNFSESYFYADAPRSASSGYWLQLASNLCVIIAVCVSASKLLRASEARFMRLPRNALTRAVVLLSFAGTLALIFQDAGLWGSSATDAHIVEVSSIAMTVWAVVTPACAAVIRPRRLGTALLAGWIWVGAAFCVYCYGFLGSRSPNVVDGNRIPVIAFALTLLALAAAAVTSARGESRLTPVTPSLAQASAD